MHRTSTSTPGKRSTPAPPPVSRTSTWSAKARSASSVRWSRTTPSRSLRSISGGFMATVAVVDSPVSRTHASRVTPGGSAVVFGSASASLAASVGYDNADAVNGKASMEVYRYDANANGGEGQLSCISCNPSGARPVGPGPEEVLSQPELQDRAEYQTDIWAAAWVQAVVTRFNLPACSPRTATGCSSTASMPWCHRTATALRTSTSGRPPEAGTALPPARPIRLPTRAASAWCRADPARPDQSSSTRRRTARTSSSKLCRASIRVTPDRYDLYDARVGGGYAPPDPTIQLPGRCLPERPRATADDDAVELLLRGPGQRQSSRGTQLRSPRPRAPEALPQGEAPAPPGQAVGECRAGRSACIARHAGSQGAPTG